MITGPKINENQQNQKTKTCSEFGCQKYANSGQNVPHTGSKIQKEQENQ
jgi:hypothetical protein